MPRGRVEREADKASGDNRAQDRNDEPQKPVAKPDEQPTMLTEHEKDHQHGNKPISEPDLDTSHLTGYDEPERPEEPPDADEPPQDVDNRTRDGMQVPVEPDDPSVQAEGSGEAGDE